MRLFAHGAVWMTLGLLASCTEKDPEPRRVPLAAGATPSWLPQYAAPDAAVTSGGPLGHAARGFDAAGSHGMRFRELSSALGSYDLVPGWGVAWVDFDGDGLDDVFFANHMHYPSALYRNVGGLRFEPAGGSLGHDIYLDDHMGVWADYDGDARPDLYTANGFYRPDHLLRNRGDGSFEEVAEKAGVSMAESGRGRSALWADLDGNGWNDVLTLNLMTPDFLYFNEGGRFRDGADAGRMRSSFSKEGAVFGDLDGDGDLDVYIPILREGQRNLLYFNRGDGHFVEYSGGSRADLVEASHAAALGDYDNDGDLDLFVASHDKVPGELLRNHGDGSFEPISAAVGIGEESAGGRSAAFVDLNNDGWLDLYVSTGGGLEGQVRPNALFLNNGDGTFRLVGDAAGLGGRTSGRTASAAFADWNGDGRLDLAGTNGADAVAISGQHTLYRNESEAGHWLRVLAPAAPGNHDGIGASVWVRAEGLPTMLRPAGLVQTMAQNAAGSHIGLGAADSARVVAVRWPDGGFAHRLSVPADDVVEIPRGEHADLVRSHPAALLGAVPLLDLEALAATVFEHAPEVAADVDAAARRERRDEVLAHALARSVADTVVIDDAARDAVWAEHRAAFERPERWWVEQIAIGPFTMRKAPLPLEWELGAACVDELAAGDSVLDVANAHRVRAWAKVYKDSDTYDPVLGEKDMTTRGYVEAGWLDAEMIRERYREVADVLMDLSDGETYGPVPLKEGRDVQDPDQVWPVLRVFRVLGREPAVTVERELLAAELDREAWRRAFRAGLERAATAAVPASAGRDGARGHLRGVPFAVEPLAAAARAAGWEEKPEVAAAFARIDAELELEARLIATRDVRAASGLGVTDYLGLRAFKWVLDPRVDATRIFFSSEEAAQAARARIAGGEEAASVLEELEVPNLRTRSARTNQSHFERGFYDAALLDRFVESEQGGADVLTLAPGELSTVRPSRHGFVFFLVHEQHDAEPYSAVEARRRAILELQKEHALRFARAALGY